jgi:two-component system, chemotaxis family, response regulator Rcp1
VNQPIELLLVEDNPADAELTRETLEDSRILHQLHVVSDGVEALAFVRQEEPYEEAPRPDLILLDLNLPRKNGHEVLRELKENADLRRIPVIILTSSQAEEDILTSYDLQAAAYVTKPVDLEGFGRIVRAVEGFWFNVVRFPPA